MRLAYGSSLIYFQWLCAIQHTLEAESSIWEGKKWEGDGGALYSLPVPLVS